MSMFLLSITLPSTHHCHHYWCFAYSNKSLCNMLHLYVKQSCNQFSSVGWPGGNSSPLLVGGTSPTQTPPKLHSILLGINPHNRTFQTVTSTAQWISPQTKQSMKVMVAGSVRENLSYFGSLSVSLGN